MELYSIFFFYINIIDTNNTLVTVRYNLKLFNITKLVRMMFAFNVLFVIVSNYR